ncbi:hypothetical protein EJB05_26032 [Eragrostis curvula]|uniref:Embryo surrounding factor 1 brassicaceae domain-containing protein n=1 Tax=Eragrostis curvula TaxID=38414 RepID=A0A5J9UIQ8_9POAL|nr:hypothetical protein EJB05_26032 [Eragrostis curvula]
MADAKATLLLLSVLLACLTIPAKCEEEDAGVPPESPTGGLEAAGDGEVEKPANSSKFTIALCFRRDCLKSVRSCYCCGMLPDTPCYLTRDKCWSVCPHAQTLRRALPDPHGFASHQLSLLQDCDIC